MGHGPPREGGKRVSPEYKYVGTTGVIFVPPQKMFNTFAWEFPVPVWGDFTGDLLETARTILRN